MRRDIVISKEKGTEVSVTFRERSIINTNSFLFCYGWCFFFRNVYQSKNRVKCVYSGKPLFSTKRS